MVKSKRVEFENNALFWQKLDSLFFSSELAIDRKKHTSHPTYANLIYPVDYGYLKDALSMDNEGIDVFVGSKKNRQIEGLVVALDIVKKDIEVKLLYGCNEDEISDILLFLNQTDYQKTIIIYRGDDIPSWAESL